MATGGRMAFRVTRILSNAELSRSRRRQRFDEARERRISRRRRKQKGRRLSAQV